MGFFWQIVRKMDADRFFGGPFCAIPAAEGRDMRRLMPGRSLVTDRRIANSSDGGNEYLPFGTSQ